MGRKKGRKALRVQSRVRSWKRNRSRDVQYNHPKFNCSREPINPAPPSNDRHTQIPALSAFHFPVRLSQSHSLARSLSPMSSNWYIAIIASVHYLASASILWAKASPKLYRRFEIAGPEYVNVPPLKSQDSLRTPVLCLDFQTLMSLCAGFDPQ